MDVMSGARSVRTMRPVMPLWYGTVKERFGSKAGWRSCGSRFASTFGIADRSMSCR